LDGWRGPEWPLANRPSNRCGAAAEQLERCEDVSPSPELPLQRWYGRQR
jgi:hypothetical protein